MFLSRTHAQNRTMWHTSLTNGSLLFFVVTISLLYLNLVRISAPLLVQTQALAVATPIQEKPAVVETRTYAPLTEADLVQSMQEITTSAVCSGTPYVLPAATSLTTQAPGLYATTDTPTYYTIAGSTVSELRDAISNCALRKEAGQYHAVTTYQLNWQYSTKVSGTSCSLGNVKVGLHINQLMPRLSPDVTLSSGAQATWDTYRAGLVAHEQGHINLDNQYARELMNALQSTKSSNCDTLASQVQLTINTYVSRLNTANQQYDARTGHGATQGAVL